MSPLFSASRFGISLLGQFRQSKTVVVRPCTLVFFSELFVCRATLLEETWYTATAFLKAIGAVYYGELTTREPDPYRLAKDIKQLTLTLSHGQLPALLSDYRLGKFLSKFFTNKILVSGPLLSYTNSSLVPFSALFFARFSFKTLTLVFRPLCVRLIFTRHLARTRDLFARLEQNCCSHHPLERAG